jgi:hypothetical protein
MVIGGGLAAAHTVLETRRTMFSIREKKEFLGKQK